MVLSAPVGCSHKPSFSACCVPGTTFGQEPWLTLLLSPWSRPHRARHCWRPGFLQTDPVSFTYILGASTVSWPLHLNVFRSGFLNLGTTDTLDEISLGCGDAFQREGCL